MKRAIGRAAGRSRLRWSLLALTLSLALPAAASADRFVYVSNGGFAGSNDVSRLHINADGSLGTASVTDVPTLTITEGLAMTPDAAHLYVASYGSNVVSGFNVNATTGALSAASGSPYGTGIATPLGVAPDPLGRWLFAWNHNNDTINVSTINANGSLSNITGSPFDVPDLPVDRIDPFAGSVAPSGDFLYVPNENNSPPSAPETVTAYSVAANGALNDIQTIGTGTLVNQTNPFGSGITPDGRFLYVSNPDDGAQGSLSSFAVNANGTLTPIQQALTLGATDGSHPLNIAISPDGQHLYVATRATNTVNAYDIGANGALSEISGSPFATDGTNGKAIAITPDGQHLYVANNVTNTVSGFNVAADGSLTLIPSSPYPTGGVEADLESIAITPNQPPVAAFSPTTLAAAGQPSTFNAAASTDDDAVARYDWNFGDGSTLANGGPTPQHTYAQPGTYTVTLTVTDDEGCSTQRIFTGKATLCNGSSVASISQQISIQAAPAAAQCIVPNVVKKKKKKAKKKILAANCSVGKIKKKHSERVPKKKVIKQKPKPGTVLPAGSPVKLKISSGPD